MANEARPERDIDLVLVTGAGASHEFGVSGTRVPLMGDWSNALVNKIAGPPGPILKRRDWRATSTDPMSC